MKSRWYELKGKAIKLRKEGLSIRKIENCLGIPRSTLSGWLRNIELTPEQKEKLKRNQYNILAKTRKKAVLWHNQQKEKRLQKAREEALKTLENIDVNDKNTAELALAFLYLGEGAKKAQETAMSNSDPLTLRFFLMMMKKVYNLKNEQISCDLNLRADQNPQEMKKFWSKALQLPLSNFKGVQVDKRTIGSKTYSHYKGICNVRCGNVAIQRKLVNISNLFCQKIVNKNWGP